MKISKEINLPAKGDFKGIYSSVIIGTGPVIPLGDTRLITDIGFCPAITYYIMFHGKGIESGFGFTAAFQYEKSVDNIVPDSIQYSRYNVSASVCYKLLITPALFFMDFYIEISGGIVGIYQDYNNPQTDEKENIGIRPIGTACIGIGIPIHRKCKLGSYCRMTVIPFNTEYWYTSCNPGLFIEFRP